eukprot:scaffold91109_cov36-Phaeocystis_antarctica.AAC.1
MSALSLALRQSACQSERNGSGPQGLHGVKEYSGAGVLTQRAARMQPTTGCAARTCRTSTRDSPSWIDEKVPSPSPKFTSALSKDCCCAVLITMSNVAPLTCV